MNLPERHRPRYRFGGFVLDPATRELRHADELLTLSPKVFDCVAYLVANRDRAVGHDELTAAVWGRADVTDMQLWQLIRKVRRAVGDDGEHQSIVRTIPSFGVHWVAETTMEDAASSPPSPREPAERSAPEVSRRPNTGRRIAAYASVAFVLAALAAGTVAWNRSRDESPAVAGAASAKSSAAIGVLPVEIESRDDAGTSWMRLGLMDFIASRLRKASVAVVASSDIVALSHGNSADDLGARVRNATGADNVLASFAARRQNGWKVRLTLRGRDGAERIAEADSPDALLAAREASDRLLILLGRNAPSAPADESTASTMELVQRVESALLVDDFRTARRLIESAPPALRDLPEFQLDLARIDSATDDDASARARLAKVLSAVSAEDDPILRARALTTLGFLDSHETEASLREYSEAIDLLVRQNDPEHLGESYLGRAITHSLASRFDEARSDYAQARVMLTLANNSLQLARADNAEAALDAEYGRPERALPLLERAAATQERFGAIDKMVVPVCNQILAHLELLQPAKALEVYQRMRPKVAGAQSKESLHLLDYLGAASLAANGRLAQSRSLLAATASAADPQEETGLLARIDGILARQDLAAGRVDEAVARASRSIRDFSTHGNRFEDSRADTWLTLTRALRSAGNVAEAKSQTTLFARWAQAKVEPAIVSRARLAEAEQYWSEAQRPLALRSYGTAMQTAERSGTPHDLRVVTESYAGALLEGNDLADASAVVGRVERWAPGDFESALLTARLYHALDQYDAWRRALDKVRALAGERPIPVSVQAPPPPRPEFARAQR